VGGAADGSHEGGIVAGQQGSETRRPPNIGTAAMKTAK
jgi:hypothetical protein